MDDVESPLGGLPRGQSVDDDTSHIERGSPDGGVLTEPSVNVLLVHAQNTAGIEMAICGLSSMASPGFVLLSRGVIQHVVVHRSSIFAEEGRWSFVIPCHHYVSFGCVETGMSDCTAGHLVLAVCEKLSPSTM